VEDALRKAARELRRPALRRARPASARWRVLDFGGLLAHLMTDETRRFYSLEKLHHQARPVAWEEAPRAAAKAGARRKANA
jgi:ribosomal silencing factor RsfS